MDESISLNIESIYTLKAKLLSSLNKIKLKLISEKNNVNSTYFLNQQHTSNTIKEEKTLKRTKHRKTNIDINQIII